MNECTLNDSFCFYSALKSIVTEYVREEKALLVIVFIEGINLEDHNECKMTKIFLEEKYGMGFDFYRVLRVIMVFYILCSCQ